MCVEIDVDNDNIELYTVKQVTFVIRLLLNKGKFLTIIRHYAAQKQSVYFLKSNLFEW